jgi:cell division protein FtsL
VKRSKKKSKKEKRKSLLRLTEAQAALGWGVILAIAAVLGAIYLHQTSEIASVGRRVQFLQNDLEEVKRVNATLEREIAEGQSLKRLQEAALKLGFQSAQPEEVEYIVIPDYPQTISLKQAPQTVPPPEPLDNMSEGIWTAFRSGIGDLVQGNSP